MKQTSMLPEPKYNPKYPNPHTLAEKALNLLLVGRTLTHPEFESLTGSWRLAAHVYILKRRGWPVKVVEIPLCTPQDDEDSHARSFVQYYLPDDLLTMMRGV